MNNIEANSLSLESLSIAEKPSDNIPGPEDMTPQQPLSDSDNQNTTNISEYDDFLASLAKTQNILKAEQQAPHLNSPLAWRQQTCMELNRGLHLAKQVLSNKLILNNRKIVEGEFFNALETLFVLCVDDGGTGEDDVSTRLNLVANIIDDILSVNAKNKKKLSLFKPAQMGRLASIRASTQPDNTSKDLDTNTQAYSKESVMLLDSMCELSFMSLVATPDRLEEIEKVRQELFQRLSTNPKFQKEFRNGGGLDIFGSSLATLASPSSDVDFCLRLPALSREMSTKRNKFENAKMDRMNLESSCPVMEEVRCLMQLSPKLSEKEVSLNSRKNKLKKRKDTLSTSERELANRIAEGEKERASRKGDEDKVAMKERDEAQKRSETKVRNKIASEERYMQEAEKKLEEANSDMIRLNKRKKSVMESLTAKFPDVLEFIKKLEKLQRVEKSAHKAVLETGKVVFVVSQTIHSTKGFPTLPQRSFQVVGRARVPVIKVTEKALGIAFDVVVNNDIALRNSLLLASYASDPRARRLMFLTKAWAKSLKLNDAPNGTPSSYCHALLVVFYLMQTPEDISEMMGGPVKKRTCSPILPNLQLVPDLTSVLVDGLETKFEPNLERARQTGSKLPVDSRLQPELLAGYFKWLSWLLNNAAHWCVSIRLGKLLGDKHLKWHNGKRWRLSVEDPFETIESHRPHDLGQVMTIDGQRRLRSACQKTVALEHALASVDGQANIEAWNTLLGLKIKKSTKHSKHHPTESNGGSRNTSKVDITSRLGPPVRDISSRLGPSVNAASELKTQIADYHSAIQQLVNVLQDEVTKVGVADSQGIVDVQVSSLMNAFKVKSGFSLSRTQLMNLAGSKGRTTKPSKLLENMTLCDFKLNNASVSVRFDNVPVPIATLNQTQVEKVKPSKPKKGEAAQQGAIESSYSEKELLTILEDLFSDGNWANLATIKTRFYSATHCKLRPALFSGKPLEKVMASIPSLKFSEGNNGNSNPRWRYQGEVVPKSTGSSNISKSTLKSSAAQSFSTSTDPPPSANVEPQQQQQHKRSPRKGKGKGKGKGK